ncbi:MAG: hypothetical protein PHU04_03500 [Candidatus Peribacteraceae bacterium]|nr:hypothetical protein [Candidatus Peribacteraceae bacterium]
MHRRSVEELLLGESLRKDFDRIIEDATQHGKLTEDHWTDLVIAYRQGQSLLQEIPNFYADDDQHLYTLDRRREALLHETVHRTLHRLDEMLRVLSKCGIDWTAYEENMTELRSLLQVVEDLTPQWQQESPYMAAFEDILHLNRKIQTLLQQTMAGRIS